MACWICWRAPCTRCDVWLAFHGKSCEEGSYITCGSVSSFALQLSGATAASLYEWRPGELSWRLRKEVDLGKISGRYACVPVDGDDFPLTFTTTTTTVAPTYPGFVGPVRLVISSELELTYRTVRTAKTLDEFVQSGVLEGVLEQFFDFDVIVPTLEEA